MLKPNYSDRTSPSGGKRKRHPSRQHSQAQRGDRLNVCEKNFGAFCLYLNYLVHGIGVLVMSLNVHEFEVQWQTDAAGVSVVISSLGLGRLALLVLAGSLSDKYGRRPFVLLGTVTYLTFFIGLLFTHDVGTAYFFGL